LIGFNFYLVEGLSMCEVMSGLDKYLHGVYRSIFMVYTGVSSWCIQEYLHGVYRSLIKKTRKLILAGIIWYKPSYMKLGYICTN